MSRAAKSAQLDLGELGVRTLRLTLHESWQFADLTGKSLVRNGLNILDLDEREFVTLLHTCIQDRDDTVTLEAVAKNLHDATFVDAFRALESLLAAYFPAPEVADTDPRAAGLAGPRPNRARKRRASTK